MNALHRLAEAANTNDYFEIGPEDARDLWAHILRLREGQASDREPRLVQLLKAWQDLAADPKHDGEKLASLSGRTRFALAAVAMNATVRSEGKGQRLDAARYRWLRNGRAYIPEESQILGYDALDTLCDEGIREG